MDILAFRLLDLHTVVYRHFLFGRYCHKKLELGVGFGWHSVSPLVISLVGIGLDGLFSFSFFAIFGGSNHLLAFTLVQSSGSMKNVQILLHTCSLFGVYCREKVLLCRLSYWLVYRLMIILYR